MKRPRRIHWLALSLLLWLAVAALWARGAVVADLLRYHTARDAGTYAVDVSHGGLAVWWSYWAAPPPSAADHGYAAGASDAEAGDGSHSAGAAPAPLTAPAADQQGSRFEHVSLRRGTTPENYGFHQVWGRFGVDAGPAGTEQRLFYLRVPFWFLFLLAGWVPARLLWQAAVERRRLAQGYCPRCGRDPRAAAEPGDDGTACPECADTGQPAAPPVPTTVPAAPRFRRRG